MNELRERARLVRDYAPVPAVLADGPRLGQVFLNLLLNAAQALPEGASENHVVRVVLRQDPDQIVRVEISDSGCGIAPDLVDRIFEPFFTTKPIGVGTGLGLSICQSIVMSMNGRITVESVPGRGSTFRVLFPLTAAMADDVDVRATVEEEGGIRARILVIDDESAIALALRRVLEEEHDVTAATNGEQALGLLFEDPSFDVVLCDVLMPGKNGIDIHREVTEHRPALANRIIFMTGASSIPRVADFFRTIRNRRIDKPVDLPLLRQLIREVARESPS